MARRFGSVIARRNRNGVPVSLVAKYVNPKDRSKRVVRGFPLGSEGLAYAWLDREEELVRSYMRGSADWTPPAERERARDLACMSFREYAGLFLDGYRDRRGGVLEASSMRLKRSDMRWLTDWFGDRRVGDIGARDVDEWLHRGNVRSAYTRRRCYQMLRAMYRRLVGDGVVSASPCEAGVPERPRSMQALIPPATRDELRVVYESMPAYTRVAVYLGAVFGLRIGEVCALRVGDVDLERMVLHVRRSATKAEGAGWELKATKTAASYDDLPIPVSMLPMLRAHLDSLPDRESGSMFLRSVHGGVLPPGTLRGQFVRARVRAGRPDLRFHTLRATGITAAAQSGASPKETQRFGRHADARTSLDLYQRATDDGRRRVADAVAGALVSPERTFDLVHAEYEQARERVRRDKEVLTRLRRELRALTDAGRSVLP